MENNSTQSINQALIGLNLDNIDQQIQSGMLTYALNAQVENFDGGEKISYQNEQSNDKCLSFPTNYVVIGRKNITSLNKTIFMLTNPFSGDSEIGYSINGDCNYNTIISDVNNDMKFNFSIDHPIHKIVTKITNCTTQIFWTDGYNPRRWMDLDDLPWKEEYNPANDFKPIKLVGQLDSNKLLVQPNFSIPNIKATSINIGGNLQMGTYQFSIQYGNSRGEGYTSYYNVTNGVSIFENKITPDYNLNTSKSIDISINNLDTTGLYEYFNLAVIKTVNNITSVELIDTFPITGKTFNYNYTGTSKDDIRLTIADIFEKYPYYAIADDIFEVDNILGWDNLTKKQRQNYQNIWSKVRLYWETWTIPYNKFEAYNNGVNSSNLRGYMRDEPYAIEGCFILDNGEQTDSCHIPGRLANSNDRVIVNNLDSKAVEINKCQTPDSKEKWQVYNTATLIGFSPEYNANDDCYIGPYQYGEFSFWESERRYPNNPEVWGLLANQFIRHHKFPDSTITTIHDNNTVGNKDYEHRVFPIGIKIDVDSVYNAINNSDLTQEEKNKIVGFKITRGNRVNNKSIIAKGLFNNVGRYTQDGDTYYFSNYPFNDLRPDPYFTTTKIQSHSGFRPDASLNAFSSSNSRSRFVFHSPDTHFYQPFGIDSGQLKIETIEYGESYGHFVQLKHNTKYKFLSRDAVYAAAGIGVASGFTLAAGTFGWPTYSPAPVISTFTATKELFEKLIPYTNFGYNFNSIGFYNKSYVVPNSGNKQRVINFGQYITDGRVTIENGNTLNNYRRESGVYINTNDPLLFPRDYNIVTIPEDTSRYNLASQQSSNYNIVTYLNDLYKLSLSNNTVALISDADIQSAIDAESFNTSTTVVAVFTIPTMPTTGLPMIDDVYSVNGGNYKITKVDYEPIDTTNSSVTLTTEVTNYQTGTYSPPPSSGTIDLTFATDGSTSTSESSITYTNVVTNPPATSSVDLASVRADIQSFASGQPDTSDLTALLNGTDYDRFLYYIIYNSYIKKISGTVAALPPEKIRKTNICSYYGSIRKYYPSQWGEIYSYETIDTGYYQNLYDNNKQPYTSFPTVFGGDIFINRFALKNKVPFFSDFSFKEPDQTDIEYDKLGNYGFPMFWLSTRAERLDINIKDEVDKLTKAIDNSPGTGGSGNVLAKIWSVIKGLVSGGFANVAPVMVLMTKIFKEIYRTVALANINFDNYKQDGIMETGLMYMFSYGVPYFFVESEVNVDYRHASNNDDKNFYPNVGTDVPDDWLQEYRVPIIYDNSYEYNQSYSKQNKENYFSHLREDYDPTKTCYKYYPNRAIYSDRSSLEETKNNWLVYRPSAYFDFTKSHGKLISLDNIETRQILARFENKSQIYNALTVVDVSQGPNAYLGNSQLFSAPPIDLFETDTGFAGSQHKFLLKTENGHIFVDAKRSQVILLDQSNKVEILSNKGVSKWLNRNLPFFIQKSFPDINIDNNYKDIGLHGVYDAYNNRILITKLDYEPLSNNITYINNKFYYKEDKCGLTEIDLTDRTKFCDRSWTLSYNFITRTWVSFHSYQPNYYIPVVNTLHFQSGIYTNNFSNIDSTLWNHDLNFRSYHNFYDRQYPFILEYPFVYKFQDEILQSVKEYCVSRKYENYNDFYEPTESIFYNKSILYNNEECSGLLNLIPSPKNNLSSRFNYPKYNNDSKDILVNRNDNIYSYNTFWNIVKSNDTPFFSQTCTFTNSEKELINTNLDYTVRSNKKGKIRGKNLKIRHILDNRNDIKIISRFINTETTKSYK